MRTFRALPCFVLMALALAGCAHRPVPVAAYVPPPLPVVTRYAPLPAFATPGMTIPAMLADGSYPTPNRGLNDAAAIWHLRAALNVAALSCSGEQGARITAAYNALLGNRKAALARAQTALLRQYRDADAANDRTAFDDDMTRLYNFYSQMPARPGLCETADRWMLALPTIADADLPQASHTALAELDRPYTDFYRAYADWRDRKPLPQPVMAIAAATRPAPAFPRIEVDPSVFTYPTK